MKKFTKGALAASAAGSLLLGGAGSLAYWTAQDTVSGGSVTAGSLKLVAVGCDASWKYAPGKAGAGNTVNLVVPGDVVTKKCTFNVTATGDHLSAKLASPASVAVSGPGTDTFTATDATTYGISGGSARALVNGDNITSADGGSVLTATFVVTIPFGDTTTTNDNDMQLSTATLDALTVSLTQNNPN
jgi:alternate signal-mediated exported protein